MRFRSLLLLAAALVPACGDSQFSGDDSNDSGTVDPGDGSTDGGSGGDAGPALKPPGTLTFVDQDPTRNHVSGEITLAPSMPETNVVSYTLYWGSDASTVIGSPFATLKANGSNQTYSIPAGTAAPDNANYIFAFAVNGEQTSTASFAAGDNYPRLDDMTGTAVPSQTAFGTGIFLVSPTNKVGTLSISNALLCDAPYGHCKQVPIALADDAGAAPGTVIFDSVFDGASQKMLGIFGTASGPSLLRCNADGTGCDDPALSPSLSLGSSAMVIDPSGGKLYIYGASGPSTGQIEVCNHDGTACTIHALSANFGPTGSYAHPRMAVDTTTHTLLIVTDDKSSAQDQLGLIRCSLAFGAGDGCTLVSIDAAANSGLTPSIAVDATSGKLLLFSECAPSASATTTSLYRCNLDGTGCAARIDLSTEAGVAPGLEEYPSAVYDSDGNHLYVGVSNSNLNAATLYRCARDGTACTTTTLSPTGASSAAAPSLRYDSATRRIYFAYQGDAGSLVFGSIATW